MNTDTIILCIILIWNPTFKNKDNLLKNNFIINENGNINSNGLTTDDFNFSKAAIGCEIMNILEDFVFLKC